MRVTDDRYTRDRLKLDLAIRLIRHEARTCTIKSMTGLTDDRIRKLYRNYVEHEAASMVRRHRGKSPRQVAWFLRNSETRRQAAVLAGLFGLCGLLEAPRTAGIATLRWGAMFCRAFETYLREHDEACISFEHAWFLLLALCRHQDLMFAQCPRCQTLGLVDHHRPASSACGWCAEPRQRARA